MLLSSSHLSRQLVHTVITSVRNLLVITNKYNSGMNDLHVTFGRTCIYSRIMESRHLSLNNTIINYRQLITSTIDADTYIETTLYLLFCLLHILKTVHVSEKCSLE